MRTYISKDNIEVPSVTTILKILGAEELMKWSNYLGFKHIDYTAELERTAERGTKIHTWVQNIIDPDNAEKYELSPYDAQLYNTILYHFNKLINDYDYTTIYTEHTMVSSELGYGGTMDWYVNLNNKKILIDFKSSKKVNFKHLLQLGAYYNLCVEENLDIEGAGILIINDKGSSLKLINLTTLKALARAYTSLVEYYKISNIDIKYFKIKDL